ncbi:MAG: SDR family oxidoreductase [Armatimonadetes bacterium]|nr:SDR family oxidoreductase [Armatimonadota bacterium]
MGSISGSRRVLLTGACGFLGSHLSDRFLADGWEVLAVDNLLTGRQENLAHLRGDARFQFIHHDVTLPLALPGPVDLVLHFASPASPPAYRRHAIHTLTTNALGTLHTLEVARACGARYVLASTSEVYGDPDVHPQGEHYAGRVDPVGPRSMYAEGKRYAEALAMASHRAWGLDVRIARIFNTYGPRMRRDDGRVIPTFIVRALQGQAILVHGSGHQTRSFCYVGDLVEGITRLTTLDGLAGDVINLGHPQEHSILDLAGMIRRLTCTEVPIAHVPRPADDPHRRCPDISAAQARLDWSPRVPLQEGLRHTIEWYRAALSADGAAADASGLPQLVEAQGVELDAVPHGRQVDKGVAGA